MGLGTYMITDAKELTEILKCAIHVGYRHFDSARFYENEYALGLAIETCIKEGRCKR
jgi:2,5-diketo-D-gluconate reductase A